MIGKSIVAKLGVSILLLVLAVLLPLGFVLNQLFTNFYFNETANELMTLTDQYADAISSVEDGQLDLYERLASLTGKELLVVDSSRIVVADSGIPGISEGERMSKELLSALAESAVQHKETVFVPGGAAYLSAGKPIYDGSGLSGGVFVLDSVTELNRSLAAVKQSVLLAGTGAVLLAIGFIFILTRKLSMPLLSMEKVTRTIAKGNLEARVAEGADDEIGSLSDAINDLAVELQRIQVNRRQFFADISHELQTPVTYLKGYAAALEKNLYQTDEERRQFERIIAQEASRLSRLISELFDLAKMEEGKIVLTMEAVDLCEITENVLEKMEITAKDKGIQLEFRRPDSVPLIHGDGMRIEQILTNLLENAVKYTGDGTVKVTVRNSGDVVETVVEDTGPGIPPADLPYVFDRFYRVEKSRSREHGGTGLGLAIVKRLTELQGGTVSVTSTTGKGTAFILSFSAMKEESV
ncbi:sensor histidine kinase [Indiicoccus explosivorum]|uniref:sensor histidine kinase n=1 Tax=Indiicoccus explosivorum TaxID=1917864 RepID=UPI001390193B|nr:HAMP domain-containing sensor histidine kinase [Indiicoccus explosivorum]